MVKFELRSMYEPFVVAVLSADEIESVLSCIEDYSDNDLSVLTLDGKVYHCDSMVLVVDPVNDRGL